MGYQMPGQVPPQLMNQQAQMFAGYGQDDMSNMSQMGPDLTAHLFSDAQLLMEDTNEAKRRRIARVSSTSAP